MGVLYNCFWTQNAKVPPFGREHLAIEKGTIVPLAPLTFRYLAE